MTAARKVSDLGEWALLDAIRAHLATPPEGQIWSGDDAAVLPGASSVVFTTDVLVAGIDFDLSYGSARSVGVKALAVNASDVAAMGGRPRAAVATLIVPVDTSAEVAEGISAGLAAAGKRYGIDLVGGDISEGQDLALNVAVVGELPGMAVTRAGANPGELVCVTGSLGGSAAGLALLRAGHSPDESEAVQRLVTRQLEPVPRIEEGIALAAFGATAMIDVSDGLISDLGHVLDASQVGCDVDPAAVPVDPDLAALRASNDQEPLELALAGGEDFELLFTLPSQRLDETRDALSLPVTAIGTITDTERLLGGRSLEEWDLSGWEHLRPR